MAYGSFSYQLSSESSNEARKAAPGKFLRFPARLRQVAVRFLCKAEIAGALDGNFLCHFEESRERCRGESFEAVFGESLVAHKRRKK